MEGRGGWGSNYYSSRSSTASASAIKWQSTETPSPFFADSTMSRPPATRAAAAACAQRMNAAARLTQPLRCAATHLKIRHRSLQHALNYLTHCARACMRMMRADTCAHTYNKFVTNTQHSAQHSKRAAAAAPALSSRDPMSHGPSPTQPSATTFGPCAYRQAQ